MKKEELKVITSITVQGKEYYLCDDGNLYEKAKNNEYILLDELNEDSKKIIQKIMERLKPLETDVIRDEKNKKKPINKNIEVELPEF